MHHHLPPPDPAAAAAADDRSRPEPSPVDFCYRSEAFPEDIGFEPSQPAALHAAASLLLLVPLIVALTSALLPAL